MSRFGFLWTEGMVDAVGNEPVALLEQELAQCLLPGLDIGGFLVVAGVQSPLDQLVLLYKKFRRFGAHDRSAALP